jgi:hypothetical protein
MNPGLLKSLEGSGLGMGEPRFHAAFGEDPASAARLNQQKFDAPPAKAIANGCDLLAPFRQPRRPQALLAWRIHDSVLVDRCLLEDSTLADSTPMTVECVMTCASG